LTLRNDYSAGDIIFQTSGGMERLVIKSNGNVGIGTTQPGAKLDVAGTVKATKFVGDGSGLTGVGTGNRHSLDAADGSPTDAVYVDNAGNVGIGTAEPSEKLDVRGNIKLHSDGSLYAPGGIDNLRIIAGRINANGTIVFGSGFSVAKIATGVYEITLDVAFPDALSYTVVTTQGPIPQTNMTTDNAIFVSDGLTARKFRIKTGDGYGSPSDRPFTFIAMGLR
jgi:hypothetical protein